MNKKSLVIFGVLLVSIFAFSFVSAGFSDWFRFTGKVTSQPTNMTVQVKGVRMAQIVFVSNILAVNPIEFNYVRVNFSVQMYDQDGFNDLNLTSVEANFSFSGATRFSPLCEYVNQLGPKTANFSCYIDMQYFDLPGSWNISVKGRDLGNGSYAYNQSTYFSYNQLKALVISPDLITWPSVDAGSLNQTSNNDPTTINNTGNYNGTLAMTAYNLLGETNSSDSIPAANMSVGIATGSLEECGIATSDLMVNATQNTITSSVSNPGNLSAGGGVGQEQIYYCIRQVPDISSQTYSTLNGGSWVVAY